MRRVFKTYGAALCGLLSVLLSGCEITELAEESAADMNVAGSWNYADTTGVQTTMVLAHADDNNVSGVTVSGLTITGGVEGSNIWLTCYGTSAVVYLDGYIAANTNSMQGVFTNTAGGVGSWVALKLD